MDLPNSGLWQAFEDGRVIDTYRGPMEMRCQDAGELVLTSGRLVACDPVFDLVQEPFSILVKPGAYPVFLSLTDLNEVALLMVQFAAVEPRQWQRAEPANFSVDSATAGVMDAKVARKLLRTSVAKLDRVWKNAEDSLEANEGHWTNQRFHYDSEANFVAFRTLGGDGTFSSYYGYDEVGRLTCLTIDFFLYLKEGDSKE